MERYDPDCFNEENANEYGGYGTYSETRRALERSPSLASSPILPLLSRVVPRRDDHHRLKRSHSYDRVTHSKFSVFLLTHCSGFTVRVFCVDFGSI